MDLKDQGKIIRMPDLDYTPDPKGVGSAFYTEMLKNSAKIAQIDGITGEKDTYGSLLHRCVRTALTMRSKGITPDDIVVICTYNDLNSVVPYFATLFLGAKVSGLDPALAHSDMVHLLKQVPPKMMFVGSELLKAIEKVLQELSANIEIVVFGDANKHTPFSRFLVPAGGEDEFRPYAARNLFDTAIIFFSSGTSGFPKGICINHFAFLGQIRNFINCGFCLNVTVLWSSLYWITPVFFLSCVLMSGCTRVVIPKFDVKVIWSSIEKHKVTYVGATPDQILTLVNQCPEGTEKKSVVHVSCGGAALVKNQIASIREGFPSAQLYTGYGQTEMAMPIACFRPAGPEDYKFSLQKPTSSGRGMPGIAYKVVDPDTEEVLGPLQQGELRLKTKFVPNGYYNKDSSEIWDADGWYKTGDIVYYDEDRCFYVMDRIKEMLKFRIFHVQPAVIEAVLEQHLAIERALVIGIPHEEDGDHPMALVVLKNGREGVTPQEIEKFVEERVDDRKRLRAGVKIVSKIPTTNDGKIRRRDIKHMILRGEL